MDGSVAGGIMPDISFGLRGHALPVMPNQRKTKARRKKRKELFAFQMCFMGALLVLVMGIKSLARKTGRRLFTVLCIAA